MALQIVNRLYALKITFAPNDPPMKKQPPVAKSVHSQPAAPAALSRFNDTWPVVAALALTFFAYLPTWNAQFVNWDDNAYVLNNTTIHSLFNFKQFFTVPVQGNYHPLTMFSLALNYAISGIQPWSYHALNLLLHLLNTYLVFKFALRLSRESVLIAFATALLFGIHPMHVESVAWVAERKDVLYGFFFLLGLISYLKYVDSQDRKAYLLSLLWFVLSLASKPAAVIFPVVLFLLDTWRGRQINARSLLEKLPFLALSAFVGYLTLQGQTSANATDTNEVFALGTRVLFFFYGFGLYLLKCIVPIDLVAFYPFPSTQESLPIVYLVSPLLFAAVAWLCWVSRKKYPVVSFGFGFYLVNLLLVLQLLIVGHAVVAERYTYIPYIGLFFILGWFLNGWFKNKTSNGLAVVTGLGVLIMFACYRQVGVWKYSGTLWNNAVKKNPSYIAYCLRGNVFFEKGQDKMALADYQSALNLKPDYVPCYDNRGSLYGRMGKIDLALADFNKALQLQPDYKLALLNRANAYMTAKQFDNAIHDYQEYLKRDPDNADAYNSIGICYQSMNKFEESLQPLNEAIRISPSSGLFYLNRSYAWNALGKMEEAKKDAQSARQGGAQIPPDYARKFGL
jgi:Tfp pilus assembly protein PilF